MPRHEVEWTQGNEAFDTLEDILPLGNEKLKILFVGRVPSPESVAVGHYWQGKHGQMLWRLLREYNILNTPKGILNDVGEDDYLLPYGYGMIDIAKKPRRTGKKISIVECREGYTRLVQVINQHKPEIIIFIYKKIITDITGKNAEYGFNNNLQDLFGGSRVFAFPMPGTPCSGEIAKKSMNELKEFLMKV